jgi:hypothetical protein
MHINKRQLSPQGFLQLSRQTAAATQQLSGHLIIIHALPWPSQNYYVIDSAKNILVFFLILITCFVTTEGCVWSSDIGIHSGAEMSISFAMILTIYSRQSYSQNRTVLYRPLLCVNQ